MQHFLQIALDIVFPPREDALRVRACTDSVVDCLYNPREISNCSILASYTDSDVRALIHEAKFHGNERAQSLLADILSRYLKTLTNERAWTLIPIPLSKERERARGYNQVIKIIQKSVAPTLPHITILTDTLIRTKNTRPQTELDRATRLLNVAGAFSVHNPQAMQGKHVIVLDDVLTTGATLHASRHALLPHNPASVTLVALAH